MSRLKEQYQNEIVDAMIKKFGYKNIMEVPKLDKIVVNMGVGEAKENAKLLEAAIKDMETITGQKAVPTKAKNAIANFKIREGMAIGCKTTLRGETLVAVLQTTDLIVSLFQTLDRDTDTDLRELLTQINDTISEKSVRGNNDTIRLLIQLTHDIFQVGTDERFTAGDICEIHLRQFLNGLDADFLFRLGRCFITVTHGATSVAAISDDDRTI